MDHTHVKSKTTKKYKSEDPVSQLHDYNIDIPSNHIYLFGEETYSDLDEGSEPGVEYIMANRFIRNLNILMRKSDAPILIHMKTCGGDWKEGMAIHDAIRACPNKVIILNYTHARSMSSLIFQAADKRVMFPHSTFMFHDGTMAVSGTVKQFYTEYEQTKIAERQMMDIYVEAMKAKGKFKDQDSKKIEKWLREAMDKKEDVFLSAEQAVEYGFADEIFGLNGVYDWDALTKG
jgi:ATP-dependent protease ClpP protease subunit